MRAKIDSAKTAAEGYCNDAQRLLKRLQDKGCWVRFKMDDESRLVRMAWAHPDQKLNAMRYSSIVMQDNTFSTNK